MVELGKVNFVLQLSRIANWSLFSAACWLTSKGAPEIKLPLVLGGWSR